MAGLPVLPFQNSTEPAVSSGNLQLILGTRGFQVNTLAEALSAHERHLHWAVNSFLRTAFIERGGYNPVKESFGKVAVPVIVAAKQCTITIETLPTEVLARISYYFDFRTLVNMSSTSRVFRQTLYDCTAMSCCLSNALWMELLISHMYARPLVTVTNSSRLRGEAVNQQLNIVAGCRLSDWDAISISKTYTPRVRYNYETPAEVNTPNNEGRSIIESSTSTNKDGAPEQATHYFSSSAVPHPTYYCILHSGDDLNALAMFKLCFIAEQYRLCLRCGVDIPLPSDSTSNLVTGTPGTKLNSEHVRSAGYSNYEAMPAQSKPFEGCMNAMANPLPELQQSISTKGAVVPVLYGFPSAQLMQYRNIGKLVMGGDHLISGACSWTCLYCRVSYYAYPYICGALDLVAPTNSV